MANDGMVKRGRALEDEYFHRKEKELIEKLQRQREAAAQMKEMAEAANIPNEDILQTLMELGYTRETVSLLHLVPLISVAWADGKVTGPERDLILEAARAHGVTDGSAASEQLNDWLANRPSAEFVDQTMHVLADLAQTPEADTSKMSHDRLLELCTRVAAASGGILGIGNKISVDERALLDQIAARLGK